MKISQTRTYLEIKVGTMQSVEVLLFLRRQPHDDLAWFNNSNNELLFAEFLQLIQNNILPRMFQDEMEDTYYDYATTCKTKAPPKRIGPGGIPIAEKNNNSNNNNVTSKKRKRMSKKALAELKRLQQQQQQDDDDSNNKKQKDVYYAFGENMHLAYQLQEIKSTSRGETLIFADNDDDNNNDDDRDDGDDHDEPKDTHVTKKKKTKKRSDDTTRIAATTTTTRTIDEKEIAETLVGNFRPLKKLSKRILVWCYPIRGGGGVQSSSSTTTTTITDPDPPGGGFPRPEMIPISELFRRPWSAGGENDHDS